MFHAVNSRSVSLAVLACALFACKLMKPSPKKLCAKAAKLGLGGDSEKCVADLEDKKKKKPKAYACSAKCISGSSDKATAQKCISACEPARPKRGAKVAAVGTSTPDTKVDSLTSSTLKRRIASYSRKAKTVGEVTNSLGWSASVVVPQRYADAYVYKVILADARSHEDGLTTVSLLKKSSRGFVESKVGNRKVLYVDCTRLSRSGSKRKCGSLPGYLFMNKLTGS